MSEKKDLDTYQRQLVQFIKNKFCSPYKIDSKKVSRNDYAKKSGISKGTLSRLNDGNGYDVPISTIYKLCNFENVSVKDFFTEFSEWIESDKLV